MKHRGHDHPLFISLNPGTCGRGPLGPAVKRGPESGNDTATTEGCPAVRTHRSGKTWALAAVKTLPHVLFNSRYSTATVQKKPTQASAEGGSGGGGSPQYSGPRSCGIPNHCLLDTGGLYKERIKEAGSLPARGQQMPRV